MASIFRQPRSPFWFAAYRGADGNRRKASTKIQANEGNRRRALAFATDLERTAEKAHSGVLIEAQARQKISEMVEHAVGVPLAFETAQSWFKTWLAGKVATKAKGTAVRYEQIARDFLTHLGSRARVNLAALRTEDVESFRAAELAMGKSPGTVRVAVKTLGAAFNAAVRKGVVSVNVAALEHPPEQTAEKAVFSPANLAALLRVADRHKNGEWGTLIRLGYYVGGRLTDLSRLAWESVDWNSQTITYSPQKTQSRGKKLVIPMHPDLIAHLRRLHEPIRRLRLDPPYTRDEGLGRRARPQQNLLATDAKAGVEVFTLRAATGKKGRTVRSLSFHSLRHTFNSHLANAGVAQEVRQMLTGHSSAEMNKRYTHLELATLRAATEQIPAILIAGAARSFPVTSKPL